MNLAQVIRRALLQCNVVKQDGTTPAIILEAELVAAAQECMDELFQIMKQADADWGLRTVDSRTTGGTAAFTFEGETYTPTSSLRTAVSTREYTLPPDFLRMKRIVCVTNGFQYIRFDHLSVADPVFTGIETGLDIAVGVSTPDIFYYDVIGRRTLHFANWPGQILDLEIMYEARQPTLWIYNGEATSVAGVTLDDATVATSAGTATRFLDSGLSTPCALFLTSDGASGHPIVMGTTAGVDFVSPLPRRVGAIGLGGPFPVASFTTDIELELTRTYPFATDASIGYMLCSAPEVMETHSALFVQWLRAYIYSKVGNDRGVKEALGRYENAKNQFRTDIQVRSTGPEFVEDFDFGGDI